MIKKTFLLNLITLSAFSLAPAFSVAKGLSPYVKGFWNPSNIKGGQIENAGKDGYKKPVGTEINPANDYRVHKVDGDVVDGRLIYAYDPNYNITYKSGGFALGGESESGFAVEFEGIYSGSIKPKQEKFYYLYKEEDDRRLKGFVDGLKKSTQSELGNIESEYNNALNSDLPKLNMKINLGEIKYFSGALQKDETLSSVAKPLIKTDKVDQEYVEYFVDVNLNDERDKIVDNFIEVAHHLKFQPQIIAKREDEDLGQIEAVTLDSQLDQQNGTYNLDDRKLVEQIANSVTKPIKSKLDTAINQAKQNINNNLSAAGTRSLAGVSVPIQYKNAGISYKAHMANLIYNTKNTHLLGVLKPYAGIGVGHARLKLKGAGQNNNAEFLPFAAQAKLGFNIDFASKYCTKKNKPMLYAGYRGLYFAESESLSSMQSAKDKSGFAIAEINNDVKVQTCYKKLQKCDGDAETIIPYGEADFLLPGSPGKKYAGKLAKVNSSLAEVKEGDYQQGNYKPTKAIGAYTQKIKAKSHLLHNLEVGVTIPFDF